MGHTEIIVILVLAINTLGPVLSLAVDTVYSGLAAVSVVVYTGEVVEVPFQITVLQRGGPGIGIADVTRDDGGRCLPCHHDRGNQIWSSPYEERRGQMNGRDAEDAAGIPRYRTDPKSLSFYRHYLPR